MASRVKERLYNNDNHRYDLPRYNKKNRDLGFFDDRYETLADEEVNIDSLREEEYLLTKELTKKLEDFVEEEKTKYIDNIIEEQKLDLNHKEKQRFIRNLSKNTEYKNEMEKIKNKKYYKKLKKEIDVKKKSIEQRQKNFQQKFNKQYLTQKNNKLEKTREGEYDRLNKLNTIKYKKKLHEYSIGDFFFEFKDSMFDVINAILDKDYNIYTYTENNRLLHIGIFIIMLVIFLLIIRIK